MAAWNRGKFMKLIFWVLILVSNHSVLGQNSDSDQPKIVPVDSVDLSQYAGVWYEIAKIPNRFQNQCARNTTAIYGLGEDGRIDVVNRCITEDGGVDEARGIAKVVDPKSNARLKVSFVRILGLSLFWGDYWIIGLDSNYHYAIVGNPSRKYGWILCREPKMTAESLNEVFEILRNQGYDPQKFEMTEQKY